MTPVRRSLRIGFSRLIAKGMVENPGHKLPPHLLTMLAVAYSAGVVQTMEVIQEMDEVNSDELTDEAVRLAREVAEGKMEITLTVVPAPVKPPDPTKN